jgi:plastocyanin
MAVELSARVMRCTASILAALFLTGVLVVAQAAEVRVLVQDGQQQPVANAAVVLRALDESPTLPSEPEASVDQIDREFVPAAISVPVNTRVLFPNKDDIRHHVYSFSQAKSFELPLYTGTPARPIEFPDEGIVTIACNIHDWMVGHIYVLDSPWHGITGDDGRWQIEGVPEGRYAVEVWHHALADGHTRIAELEVSPEALSELEARIDITEGPAPRRAPRPGRRGYR